ncbi:MAG: helix-turn-helix transcriptional regulator [Deltaproteobacteria bacterium]|nr:helix-turn-helix transcriptional regulator [Deltaproteobacteria bacterium]
MQAHKNQEALKKFGTRVRQNRLDKGISQEELAELANVHRTYIGMIERGEKNITLNTMLNITNALGIKLTNLIEEL